MKIITLILLLAMIPIALFADNPVKNTKYSRGRIYFQNRDTVDVYIKNESLYNMQSGIRYLDKSGHELTLASSKAKGFCLFYKNETIYFESRKDLNMVLFRSKKDKSSFIQRVSTGSLPLYYFMMKKFVTQGTDMVSFDFPTYMILLDQEWYTITEEYFVSNFKKLISNLKGEYNAEQMKALMNEIVDGKYKFEETPLVIEKFNTNKIEKILN